MEVMETNLVFPDKNIKTKSTKSVANNSYTIEYSMTNKDKLKIIKKWYEDYKNTKTFNLYLKYNEKTYNLYSFSLKGGNINVYFTYSDESKTYGFGMKVINIDNEFPTFISDTPDFDISTLTKQEGTGGTGTNNYDELQNKPSINGVELKGNLSSDDLNLNGGTGTTDYNALENIPTLNNVKMKGNLSFTDLGLNNLSQEDMETYVNNAIANIDPSSDSNISLYVLQSNTSNNATDTITDMTTKENIFNIYKDYVQGKKMVIMIKETNNNIIMYIPFCGIHYYNGKLFIYFNRNTSVSNPQQCSSIFWSISCVISPSTSDYISLNPTISKTTMIFSPKTYVDNLVGDIQTLLEAI